MDIAIQKADARVRFVSSDEEALRLYEMREKALSDWTSGVNHAVRENRKEIARKALAKGATVEFVHEITGLTEQQIKDL